jgi:hypothetical protein
VDIGFAIIGFGLVPLVYGQLARLPGARDPRNPWAEFNTTRADRLTAIGTVFVSLGFLVALLGTMFGR